MVVNQLDVISVSVLETENDPPVRADRDGPEAFSIPRQGMEPVSRQVERLGRRGHVEQGKNVLHRFKEIRPDEATIASLIEPTEPAVFEAADHGLIVKRNLSLVKEACLDPQ